MSGKKLIVIACGGTGGHVVPGMALGEEIREEFKEYDIFYVFSGKKIEENFVTGISGRYLVIREVRLLKPRDVFSFVSGIFSSLFSLAGLFAREKVALVIGFGSMSSFLTLLTGKIFLKPCVVLEQNAVMGRANRIASLWAEKVYLSFPLKRGGKEKKYMITGNPIRRSVINGMKLDREKELEKKGLEKDKLTFLVVGGSQGAYSLNKAILTNLKSFKKEMPDLQFIHITGETLCSELAEAYQKNEVKAFLRKFSHEMPALYRISDLAFSRAGAGVLFELSFFGLPAVLVPYPFAKDDHQQANAEVIADAGGAVILNDRELEEGGTFFQAVKEMYDSRQKRREMSDSMKRSLPHDASVKIVGDLKILL